MQTRVLARFVGAFGFALLAGQAHAQFATNDVYNPGFEIVDPGDPERPEGWNKFNTARYRRIGDGLGPILVRNGEASVELPGQWDFVGFTTNIFNIQTGNLYDPPYVYLGGPVKVSGWYAIPADQPIVDAKSAIKLEFRRIPPNFSVFQGFENLIIDGHTNGEWKFFEMTVNCDQMFDEPDPTLWPASASVLPMRFGSSTSTGTIFWDDVSFTQCRADADCDLTLTINDFIAFQTFFAIGDHRADFDGDGSATIDDFISFQTAFALGCP